LVTKDPRVLMFCDRRRERSPEDVSCRGQRAQIGLAKIPIGVPAAVRCGWRAWLSELCSQDRVCGSMGTRRTGGCDALLID
jgi:hypothetical protein